MNQNEETFITWNKVASLYQEKFMELGLYNETYDFICQAVEKQNAGILEIGCGPGNISRYLLKQRPDFKLLGIDVAPNMIALARKNNPEARFAVRDCRNLDNIGSGFDALVAGFCLPYLSPIECGKLISDAAFLLQGNGSIYLSIVEGNPEKSGFIQGSSGRVFFHYHRLDDIERLLSENKFHQQTVWKVSYPVSETAFEIHTILTARKKSGE